MSDSFDAIVKQVIGNRSDDQWSSEYVSRAKELLRDLSCESTAEEVADFIGLLIEWIFDLKLERDEARERVVSLTNELREYKYTVLRECTGE